MAQMNYFWFVLIFLCIIAACQNNSGEQTGSSELQEMISSTQLMKIPIQEKAQADSLINSGIDVIVVEDTYVVARLIQEDQERIQMMNLKPELIEEIELVQRLVKIAIREKTDVAELIKLGIDVWDVKSDTVTAQVFDKHIRQAESKGYTVVIVARNVLDTVKK